MPDKEVSILDDLVPKPAENVVSEEPPKPVSDPLDDLLADLDKAAEGVIGEPVPEPEPSPAPTAIKPPLPQPYPQTGLTPIKFDRPQIRLSRRDFEDAQASEAGLERVIQGYMDQYAASIETTMSKALAELSEHVTQSSMSRTVQAVSPLIEQRVQTQATISEWWIRNPDLMKVRNLVGAAANRIAAANPDMKLGKLLDESGKEVRKLIKQLEGRKSSTSSPASQPDPAFAGVTGTRKGAQAGDKKGNSIMAQLGFK